MVWNWAGTNLANKINKLAIASTIYTIWRDRNNRFHTNSYSTVESVVSAITLLIRGRVVSYSAVEDTEANRRIAQDWGLPSSIFH